jgi:hypothetical protein
MRLWTIHPSYLDAVGLVAAWREGLLAQKVLGGGTKGYVRHPQLERFKGAPDPARAVAAYLREILLEARSRGYSFDASKIEASAPPSETRIAVNEGQIRYELELLRWKLERRSPDTLARLPDGPPVRLNGAFALRSGPIEAWEKVIEEVRARMGGG